MILNQQKSTDSASNGDSTAGSTKDVFAEIGQLLSSWTSRLRVQDDQHNNAVQGELETFGRRAPYERTRTQQERIDFLRASLRPVRSVAHLKTRVPGIGPVLAGSANMDTGAAFMLIGSYANLRDPQDLAVSNELSRLVIQAGRQTGPVAATAVRRRPRNK